MKSRTRIALAVGVALLALAVGLLCCLDGPGDRAVAAIGPPAVGPPAAVPEALSVLSAWDRQRSAAYASRDLAALGALYVPGSATGRRDLRVLRAYADRGLLVRGMRMQVLACDITYSGPRRIQVVVTDRLLGAFVIRARDPTPIRLPADRPSRRVVTFVRRAGRWLVAEVRTAARPR